MSINKRLDDLEDALEPEMEWNSVAFQVGEDAYSIRRTADGTTHVLTLAEIRAITERQGRIIILDK